MSTITQAQQQKIADYLATHDLPPGLGTEESACSVAAINLVLTGKLTDRIPACMSRVIGRWIIRTQDALPHEMRNSLEWKTLLPLAAGTGREHESARRTLILDWLWSTVLPEMQASADARGFGNAWRQMCGLKTSESAKRARSAADAAYAAAYDAADAAYVAYAAAYVSAYVADAAYAADAAAYAAADAADAADASDAAAYVAAYADAYADADADADAADAAVAYAADAREKFWQQVNPCGLLAQLIAVSEDV